MGLIESLSTAGKVIAAIWRHGSRFLFSIACACTAVAIVLRLGVYFEMAHGKDLWEQYGLILTVAATAAWVLTPIKYLAEKQNRLVVFIPDEQQSFWHHVPQPDGKVNTQFAFQFYITNMTEGPFHPSRVRISWPWIHSDRILTSLIATKHPRGELFSRDFAVRSHGRQPCSADLMVIGAVGGAKRTRPMTVSIRVQDHAGRWHKIVFRRLRDPRFRSVQAKRSWLAIGLIVAAVFAAVVVAVEVWGWIYYR